jgi:hypothetical protein
MPSAGQETYVGLLGGLTDTRVRGEQNHRGATVGAFFQMDLSDHWGIRSEASWVETGYPIFSPLCCQIQSGEPDTAGLHYAEINAVARLSFASRRLRPLGALVGLSLFTGGWLGTHIDGSIEGTEPSKTDFGHIVGVGLFWRRGPLLVQADARSCPGEVRYWERGPRRDGSRLVFSLGYQVH